MAKHYTQPKGFVGRNICYAVTYNGIYYGHIVGGSATRHLAARDKFFTTPILPVLNRIVNNIFFHIEKSDQHYPTRNFGQLVLKTWRGQVAEDWEIKYRDQVIGFESLVELPRLGTVYLRDGWREVGVTKGYSCKRTAGKGTDSWTGKRVWDTVNLRPKHIFVKLKD